MNPPINVFDYEALAQVTVPLVNWDFFYGGSDDEVTLWANRSAFECIRLRLNNEFLRSRTGTFHYFSRLTLSPFQVIMYSLSLRNGGASLGTSSIFLG